LANDSLFIDHSMDFHVGLGFPLMEKIIMATILLAIAILVAVVRFVVRRVRRRRTSQG